MEYDIKSLLEFARANILLFEEKYEMFLTKPEDLIGKKVVSIRAGFSGDGGQVMLVDKIDYYKEGSDARIHLIPCEESVFGNWERENHRGWSCRFDERVNSIIFYKKV